MSPSKRTTASSASDFVQLLREFLTAHEALESVFTRYPHNEMPFAAFRELVGDDDRAVLYRLKEKSHALFRFEGLASEAVRREALFDLAVGSLFHEAMKLRESLYQREVYAPRIALLREASDEGADDLFVEFDRILAKGVSRLDEVVSEVRALLEQTRDQLRRLLIERARDRVVTRCLLSRRRQVDLAFPEGFEGLLEAMHGNVGQGLVEAARALLESAYFVEAASTLREAEEDTGVGGAEVDRLRLYAVGMQAFMDGDYTLSIETLASWADAGAPEIEPDFARWAASALSRIGRLVEDDAEGKAILKNAQLLQGRLEATSA
jgi:hypothetical protein